MADELDENNTIPEGDTEQPIESTDPVEPTIPEQPIEVDTKSYATSTDRNWIYPKLDLDKKIKKKILTEDTFKSFLKWLKHSIFKENLINEEKFVIEKGGAVSWSALTQLSKQPRFAYVRLDKVSIDGEEKDCFVEIKSFNKSAYAVFTYVETGQPLPEGTIITFSGAAYCIL